MQIFVKIGGHYFEISQFEKFVVTLGTGPEKLIFDRSLRFGGQASSENLVMDRFLPQDSKNLIKKFLRPPYRELWRHLLWTKKIDFLKNE